MQVEYEASFEGDKDLKRIVKLVELNKLSYEALILSTNNIFSFGKVLFKLVIMQKAWSFLRETVKLYEKGS